MRVLISLSVADTSRTRVKMSACFAACLAWLALVLCSMATPGLTFAPSQAEISQRHGSTHNVFLEDASEASEESEGSEHDSPSDSFLANVCSSASPRFVEFSADENVSSASQSHGRSVHLAFAARGPPTCA